LYIFFLLSRPTSSDYWFSTQNFLLGTLFRNGGIAILLSALSALYQMTYAGFFVHLASIPPVLRWLQWLCPLKVGVFDISRFISIY
jgi:ABC-2 type transporter